MNTHQFATLHFIPPVSTGGVQRGLLRAGGLGARKGVDAGTDHAAAAAAAQAPEEDVQQVCMEKY